LGTCRIWRPLGVTAQHTVPCKMSRHESVLEPDLVVVRVPIHQTLFTQTFNCLLYLFCIARHVFEIWLLKARTALLFLFGIQNVSFLGETPISYSDQAQKRLETKFRAYPHCGDMIWRPLNAAAQQTAACRIGAQESVKRLCMCDQGQKECSALASFAASNRTSHRALQEQDAVSQHVRITYMFCCFVE